MQLGAGLLRIDEKKQRTSREKSHCRLISENFHSSLSFQIRFFDVFDGIAAANDIAPKIIPVSSGPNIERL